MQKNGKKFDYNIVVIALCFMMILFGLGLWSAKSLYVVPITSALGITRSAFSLADTMRYVSTAIVNIFFGYLVGKFGSKKLICAGFIALTGAAVLYATANTVWVFYIGGVLLGIGLSWTSTTIVGYIVNKACKKNRGTIMGAVLAANGVSGAIMAQVVSYFINNTSNPFGYRKSYVLMAVVAAIMFVILLIFYREPKNDETTEIPKKRAHGTGWVGVGYDQAKRKAYFYYACVCILFTGFVLQGVSSVSAAHMSDVGLDGGYIATVVSVSSLALAAFKFINGFIYDRKGLRFTITVDCIAAVISMGCLLFMKNSAWGMVLAMAYAVLSALSLPLETVMIPIYANDLFGDKSFSKVLGIFVSFNQIGYALGAPIINLFYDFTGSYQSSLLICIGIMLAVVALLQYVITCAHKEKIRIEKDVIKE